MIRIKPSSFYTIMEQVSGEIKISQVQSEPEGNHISEFSDKEWKLTAITAEYLMLKFIGVINYHFFVVLPIACLDSTF